MIYGTQHDSCKWRAPPCFPCDHSANKDRIHPTISPSSLSSSHRRAHRVRFTSHRAEHSASSLISDLASCAGSCVSTPPSLLLSSLHCPKSFSGKAPLGPLGLFIPRFAQLLCAPLRRGPPTWRSLPIPELLRPPRVRPASAVPSLTYCKRQWVKAGGREIKGVGSRAPVNSHVLFSPLPQRTTCVPHHHRTHVFCLAPRRYRCVFFLHVFFRRRADWAWPGLWDGITTAGKQKLLAAGGRPFLLESTFYSNL